MALNQTNKLVWIVETIYKARKITFEELNRHYQVLHHFRFNYFVFYFLRHFTSGQSSNLYPANNREVNFPF